MNEDHLRSVLTSNFNRAMLTAETALDKAKAKGWTLWDAEAKLKILTRKERACRQGSKR